MAKSIAIPAEPSSPEIGRYLPEGPARSVVNIQLHIRVPDIRMHEAAEPKNETQRHVKKYINLHLTSGHICQAGTFWVMRGICLGIAVGTAASKAWVSCIRAVTRAAIESSRAESARAIHKRWRCPPEN